MSLSVYIQYFKDKHQEITGQPYMVIWGKDNRTMKVVSEAYGTQKTVKLIDAFFKRLKSDEFLQQTGASIGVFKSQIPKLIMDLGKNDEQEGLGKL